MATQHTNTTTFRVLDALDGPHGGRILRLRLETGEAPTLKRLKGSTLTARGPEGRERRVEVLGFPVFGGRPSDDRLEKTGRIDLHVSDDAEGPPVGLRWTVHPE